jgi:hypothetical protein
LPPIIINRSQYPYPSGPVVVTQRVPVETPVVTNARYDAVPQTVPSQVGGSVDLVLENVELVQPATLVAGPAYRVMFRNQGTLAVGKFRVGVFAQMSEGLAEDAPRAITEIAGLAADQAGEITLRLPKSALQMVSSSSAETRPFEQLTIAVDLDDAVREMDETNNVAQIERAALEMSAQ